MQKETSYEVNIDAQCWVTKLLVEVKTFIYLTRQVWLMKRSSGHLMSLLNMLFLTLDMAVRPNQLLSQETSACITANTVTTLDHSAQLWSAAQSVLLVSFQGAEEKSQNRSYFPLKSGFNINPTIIPAESHLCSQELIKKKAFLDRIVIF